MRLSGKAYVLPKTGQQGIPLVSVNTDEIKVEVYRIGDRNLVDTVIGGDFQRNLYNYSLDDIADQKGEQVWTGDHGRREGAKRRDHHRLPRQRGGAGACSPASMCSPRCRPMSIEEGYNERATQWFIVSDLGLAAYSGGDGIHAFVNSLATTAPVGGVELRLLARNNEVLATQDQ